jgi:hypothetical protein
MPMFVQQRFPSPILVMGLLAFPSVSFAGEISYREILSGRVNGSLDTFVVSDADASLLKPHFKVSHYDGGRNVISKFSDPAFLECSKTAGLPFLIDAATVVGAATEHPTIVTGAAVLDTAAGEFQIKRMAECNEDWLDRVAKSRHEVRFEITAAQIGWLNTKTSGIIADLVDAGSRLHDLELKITTSGKSVDARIKKGEQSLAAVKEQGQKTTDALNALTKELKDSKEEFRKAALAAEVAARIEDRRFAVESAAIAASVVGKIVFSKNPVASAKFAAGVGSVQKIADSIVSLCKPGLKDGAKLLMSANIASAALGLVGMIGSSQGGEAAIMLQQLNAIRANIAELRQEMHERFDQLQKLMVEVAAHLDRRLDRIDVKLDRLLKELNTVSNNVDALVKLSSQSFAFLISDKYAEMFRQCLRQSAVAILPADRFMDCLENAVTFGVRGSRLAIISAAASYNRNIDLDVAASLAANLDPGDRPGYLEMVLRDAARRGVWPDTLSTAGETVSPQAWGDAVDLLTYLIDNVSRFQRMAETSVSRENLVDDFKGDFEALRSTGEEAKKAIQTLRENGTLFAVDRYEKMTELVGKRIARDILDILASKNLEITTVALKQYAVETNGDGTGPYGSDGLVRFSIRYFRENWFVVSEGPEVGRYWNIQKRDSSFAGWNEVMPQHAEGSFTAQETRLMVTNPERIPAPFSPEFEKKLEDYFAALPEINRPYLDNVSVSGLTKAGRAELAKSILQLRDGGLLKNACVTLTPAQLTIQVFASLLRSGYGDVDAQWQSALAELPGGADGEAACNLIAHDLFGRIEGSNLSLPEGISKGVQEIISGKTYEFKSKFMLGEHGGYLEEIDSRLDGLSTIVSGGSQ